MIMTTPNAWGPGEENCHGLRTSARCVLDANRTAPSEGTAKAKGWATNGSKSPGIARNHFHSAHGRGVEHAPQGNGMRQWGDMLASISRLDSFRHLVESIRAVIEPFGSRGRNQFETCDHRQPISTCCFWGDHTGPNPTDRAKNGCKRHVITDANGLPLVIETTPANRHDSKPALDLLDSIPPIQGAAGRPRFRPDIFQGDAAYGVPRNIAGTRERRITPLLALNSQRKAAQKHGSGLGKFRYVVERVMVWIGHNRRLKMCYEKTGSHFQAFHDLAASLICARRLASRGF